MFVQDVYTEVEYLNDLGKLFLHVPSRIQKLPSLHSQLQQHHTTPNVAQEVFEEEAFEHDVDDQVFPDDDRVEEESSVAQERLAQCISDCFAEFCFVNKTMDLERFSLVHTLFGEGEETGCLSTNQVDSVKCKILSQLLRKNCHAFFHKEPDGCFEQTREGNSHFHESGELLVCSKNSRRLFFKPPREHPAN